MLNPFLIFFENVPRNEIDREFSSSSRRFILIMCTNRPRSVLANWNASRSWNECQMNVETSVSRIERLLSVRFSKITNVRQPNLYLTSVFDVSLSIRQKIFIFFFPRRFFTRTWFTSSRKPKIIFTVWFINVECGF